MCHPQDRRLQEKRARQYMADSRQWVRVQWVCSGCMCSSWCMYLVCLEIGGAAPVVCNPFLCAHVYTCIHVHMHVCMHTYIYVCTSIIVCTCLCMFTCAYVYIFMYVHACADHRCAGAQSASSDAQGRGAREAIPERTCRVRPYPSTTFTPALTFLFNT